MRTLRIVLDQLATEGLAPPANVTPPALDASDSTPWYLHALVGSSAWIAAALLLGFLLSGLDIIRSGPSMIVVGLILCSGAIGVRRASTSVFVVQLALALSMAGQMLYGIGVTDVADSVAATVLAIIALEIALIAIYPDAFHRFLSTIVIVAVTLILLLDWEAHLAIHALVAALAAGVTALWLRESALVVAQVDHISRPVGYGLAIALPGILCLGIGDLAPIANWWISSLGLLLALLAIEYHIVVRTAPRADATTLAWLVGGTMLTALPALWTPGILAAAIILALGFQRGNRLLIGLASAFLAAFLITFYYNLEITLLLKSLMLLGSGLLLLGLRYLLSYRRSLEEEHAR